MTTTPKSVEQEIRDLNDKLEIFRQALLNGQIQIDVCANIARTALLCLALSDRSDESRSKLTDRIFAMMEKRISSRKIPDTPPEVEKALIAESLKVLKMETDGILKDFDTVKQMESLKG